MQLLSKVFSVKMVYRQLITIILSIYKNFSLQEDFRASNHPYGAHQPLPLSTPESLHGGGTPSLSDQSIPDEEVWRYRTQKGENGQT